MRIVLGKYTDDKFRNMPNIPYRIAADYSGISPMGVFATINLKLNYYISLFLAMHNCFSLFI